jgi:hypothetical protein
MPRGNELTKKIDYSFKDSIINTLTKEAIMAYRAKNGSMKAAVRRQLRKRK